MATSFYRGETNGGLGAFPTILETFRELRIAFASYYTGSIGPKDVADGDAQYFLPDFGN